MTHNITKTALFSIVVLGTALFCGCNRQEKELFDMSGTERTEAAMTKTAEILTSAEMNRYKKQGYTRGQA